MKKGKFILLVVCVLAVLAGLFYVIKYVPLGEYYMMKNISSEFTVPLDDESPWPKFRANELQNGRSTVVPKVDENRMPWEFATGKGIFSSPVVGKDGTVYIGSADKNFYAIDIGGNVIWQVETGEIIDSSALLDDKGRIYFGSGDGHVYCLNRKDGEILWTFEADTPKEVEERYDIETFNVNWFEGNIAMLADGTILAPNDNYLVYALNPDDGSKVGEYLGNEMIWSSPAVNTETNNIFFGSCYTVGNNVMAYDVVTGEKMWSAGGLGTVASTSLLTNSDEKGAVVIGGFDGYLRAIAQDSGKVLWKFGVKDHIYASPAQLSDGTLIIPAADGTVYAVDANSGKMVWAFDTLEPIRSSPAVDANDTIYVGSGEGKLFAINKDGTMRWAYQCIMDERNDLNSSPALGYDGVYIAGENGGIFFVPYDYPLTDAGMKDKRCIQGPDEVLPEDGEFMIYTTRLGKLYLDEPAQADANQPLVFTLFVREDNDTILSAIDAKSIKVTATGDPKIDVTVSANNRFITITPKEYWTDEAGGQVTVKIEGTYKVDLNRFGLKFFGGKKGGEINKEYTFTVPARTLESYPFYIPQLDEKSSVFEFSRLAVPNPTMLPSWNQIGFDSLHYIAGIADGNENEAIVWVIGGKNEGGQAVVDPSLEVRYPLTLEYDKGLLTFRNYEGFKINFIGSWDMPFAEYRIASKLDENSDFLGTSMVTATTLCDEIEFYGRGLKVMGMSDLKTGKMYVCGGMEVDYWQDGYLSAPNGIGTTQYSADENAVSLKLENCKLKQDEHVYSLLLIDEDGVPVPLYYTRDTLPKFDADGNLMDVSVALDGVELNGSVTVHFMVDTYPADSTVINFN